MCSQWSPWRILVMRCCAIGEIFVAKSLRFQSLLMIWNQKVKLNYFFSLNLHFINLLLAILLVNNLHLTKTLVLIVIIRIHNGCTFELVAYKEGKAGVAEFVELYKRESDKIVCVDGGSENVRIFFSLLWVDSYGFFLVSNSWNDVSFSATPLQEFSRSRHEGLHNLGGKFLICSLQLDALHHL